MTKTFTMESQDEGAPPQWLVSAFLVLLSVAILAAAVPSNSAANRGTAQATGAFEGLAERIVVRARIQIRMLPPQPAGSPDFALVTGRSAPISFQSDRILPRVQDVGTRIAQRGIKIRAPPADIA